jgi:predicted anti-sigma-YlaC factor YlaD
VNCQRLIVELTEYLDGDLEPSVRVELELHLANCHNCRIVVNTTRQTIEIFCNAEPAPLPEDVRGRLHDALVKRLEHHRPTKI